VVALTEPVTLTATPSWLSSGIKSETIEVVSTPVAIDKTASKEALLVVTAAWTLEDVLSEAANKLGETEITWIVCSNFVHWPETF